MLLSGVDIGALAEKALVASTTAAALWTLVGNLTRTQPIDPSLVAPGVHSESMAAIVAGLRALTGKSV
jgi:hypothetical protein